MGRQTGLELNVGEGWVVMSKRFLKWAQTWIEENIPPGANPDLESHEANAKRLSEKLFADAAKAGFTNSETEEEQQHVPPLVLAAVSPVRAHSRRITSPARAAGGRSSISRRPPRKSKPPPRISRA